MCRAMGRLVYLVIIGLSVTGGVQSQDCNLGEWPLNGLYSVIGCNNRTTAACRAIPGTPVPSITGLEFTCNEGYRVKGHVRNYCVKGEWIGIPPTCVSADLPPSNASCTLPAHPRNGYYKVAACDDSSPLSECQAIPGLKLEHLHALKFTCNEGFALRRQPYVLQYCIDGAWEGEKIDCLRAVGSTGFLVAAGCYLPNQPSNGSYTAEGCVVGDTSLLCMGIPLTFVKSGTVLNYYCDAGYRLQGHQINACHEGKWLQKSFACVPVTCEPLTSKTLDIACWEGSARLARLPCDRPTNVGAEADLSCKSAYQELIESGYKRVRCLPNGKWNYQLFDCSPVCGKRVPKGDAFISNAEDGAVGDFPWHVGVYKKRKESFSQICGGSLISTRMILSAAHCFWNPTTASPNNKENYVVILGKYYRSYDADEPMKQIRELADIHIPARYKHKDLYLASDIALVVIKEEVTLTWVVQPVCIDWLNEKERFQLRRGEVGSVVGWGITETEKPSEILKKADLPFVDFDTCWNSVPETFQPYITTDKFCAGYSNGTSVCPGDSGGGLSFELNKGDINSGVWYLRGVVSVGVSSPEGLKCTIDKYTGFTKVSDYRDWIWEFYKQLT